MRIALLILATWALSWSHAHAAFAVDDSMDRKSIVVIAGLKSHGPEGNGIHDYAWSARLIKTMLEHSNIADAVEVTLHLNGWPTDTGQLIEADAVMIISDGRDGDIGREAPHLATPERIALMDELVARGCGVVTFHFSTFAPDALADRVLEWSGGYFDWETDGRREWYSEITTTEAEVTPASTDHSILRGVEPFTVREEFYHDIRFRDDRDGWLPVWQVEALPATTPHGDVVAWAIEREQGGRGFATTCGHFYDNWESPDFRKTILNGLAWAAHVAIPLEGIEAPFFDHDQIAEHLSEPNLISDGAETVMTTEDEEAYADEPYWYQPGHPLRPAEARAITTPPGFLVEKILDVPEDWGSWTAIAVDPQGRLICAAQHVPGLYRVTVPGPDKPDARPEVERLGGVAEQMGWSHGLLAAFGSLYVTVSEGNDEIEGGVYRLRDTDGDDQYDRIDHLIELDRSGEHGPHNIVVGPDGASLYMICGNGTNLPDDVVRRLPSATDGIDHLMPPGFESSEYTPAGFVIRFRPDGSDIEFVSGGLRNSFDLAFNQVGDLFTFDSDMEWDLGTPWYRPTRICHLVPGGEFGWRGDAAKWPDYYEDSAGSVVDVGPASPTGVAFGYETRFPAKYQRALYACDWTFATIHAVHLRPEGATYRAEVEEFVGGNGLPVTDLVVGTDGALYFLVGGRRLGSALYRVRYVGDESTEPVTAIEPDPSVTELQRLRRQLEAFHGRRSEEAVSTAWLHLGHDDRAIRFAARLAVESQPVDTWRSRAFDEPDLPTRIVALLALARQDEPENLPRVLEQLAEIEPESLNVKQTLIWLRAIELALARGEDEIEDRRELIVNVLRPALPHDDPRVNRELARLLCFVGDREVIDPILNLMGSDQGERPALVTGNFVRNPKYGAAVRDILQAAPLVDRMHYAQMLLWIDDGWSTEQRSDYFQLIADAVANTKGGYWYVEFWDRIREVAFDQISDEDRDRFEAIGAGGIAASNPEDLPRPEGPGQDWNLDDLLEAVEDDFRNRDHLLGQRSFAAAKCVSCHRFNGQGAAVGPDLSSIGQRFTIRDILDSTLYPSKAVSDQYRVTLVLTDDGRTLSGRVVSRDSEALTIATNLYQPSRTTRVELDEVEAMRPVPISTMPEGLLDPLNVDEILDLLAYLISGGDPNHPVFARPIGSDED